MNRERQKRAPIYEALEKFRRQRVVPFDVPGHKRGRGNPELTAFLGQQDAGDWQQLPELNDACTVYSPARELCLYLYREEGRAAWRVYSLSRQEADDLTEMLIDYRDNIQAAAVLHYEKETVPELKEGLRQAGVEVRA